MTDINDGDEIRKQVLDRVEQEAAQIAASDPDGSMAQAQEEITDKFIDQCLFANELGDGMLFAKIFRDKFIYCKNSQSWYSWAGHYWRRDVMGLALAGVEQVVDKYLSYYKTVSAQRVNLLAAGEEAKSGKVSALKDKADALLARARQLRGVRRRSNCLDWAHTCQEAIAITGDEFDNHPLLFPCANGVIDLETGRLNPGRPSDYLSLASPIEFQGIDTPAPIWECALMEIFAGNEKLVAYVQRLFGYAMTGLVKEKVFVVLFGPTGWNGRSLIVETISYAMGDLAGSIPAEMLLAQRYAKSASAPSPDIISLKGVRLAFASEIDEDQKFSTAKIKWLTGKDELNGRSPHDRFSTRFCPTHKLFLMTNTQPEAAAHDKAFWERLHLIVFTISFVNRDPLESHERRAILDLDAQLREEAPGILAWMVRGCLFYQRDGLNPPMEIIKAREDYRRNEDVLADFIDECCLREDGAKCKANALYARYCAWYNDNVGTKPRSGTWFGKQLRLKFLKTKVNGCVIYHGIDLLPMPENNDDRGGLETL
ncbi:MAG: DNA primase [Deltaproteobacteria bacterium]|nr:DNA primase [Deltaproteobacteria bacterium]